MNSMSLNKLKIMHVVGARPNFMKIAPIMREMEKFTGLFEQVLVHTGQHYDINMSEIFFDELELPKPSINLEVGSGSHAWQTAEIMLRFEPLLLEFKPDWVVVPGDVNSTLACSLVASKLGIKIAHIEAGLRSFDTTMPEEINRVVTDHLADLLFTPSKDADENLLKENISPEKIKFVGNVMMDTLTRLLPKAEARWPGLKTHYGFDQYVLVTLHRPSNVDAAEILTEIMGGLMEISQKIPVIFPVHPRARQKISKTSLYIINRNNKNLHLVEPLGYLDFLSLEAHAKVVITDSGGIQEETTFLGVPCLTARPNTERPVTLYNGTNRLVASKAVELLNATNEILGKERQERFPEADRPALWDGKASERIVAIFRDGTK
jgi:UDP-N-acetylglucosamine 2-epimerase (non-hydrolysing)